MAEPGDPKRPEDDFDDQVGFSSPESIAGRPVERAPDAPPSQAGPEPQPESQPEPWPEPRSWPEPEAEPAAQPAAPPPTRWTSRAERRRALEEEPRERLIWAMTLYALILFAVPTLGFSAIIGLLAVNGRTVDASPSLQSHYVYQQRTLWAAAITALIGLVLIVVNLGIFVLFLLAIWTLARGASGVWRLKNARPISNPRSWLF